MRDDKNRIEIKCDNSIDLRGLFYALDPFQRLDEDSFARSYALNQQINYNNGEYII